MSGSSRWSHIRLDGWHDSRSCEEKTQYRIKGNSSTQGVDKKVEPKKRQERTVSDREWENEASIEETKGEVLQGGAVVRPTKNKTENV